MSSTGVKMKEMEDVYFFALYGNGLLSRDLCLNSFTLNDMGERAQKQYVYRIEEL
jgi:hypothetical protein